MSRKRHNTPSDLTPEEQEELASIAGESMDTENSGEPSDLAELAAETADAVPTEAPTKKATRPRGLRANAVVTTMYQDEKIVAVVIDDSHPTDLTLLPVGENSGWPPIIVARTAVERMNRTPQKFVDYLLGVPPQVLGQEVYDKLRESIEGITDAQAKAKAVGTVMWGPKDAQHQFKAAIEPERISATE